MPQGQVARGSHERPKDLHPGRGDRAILSQRRRPHGDPQTAKGMQRTRLGIGAKIFIAVILVVVVVLLVQEGRQSARINELAELPPCALAAEYARWRLAFEEQHPAAERTGDTDPEFVEQNELFEQAVRQAREDSDSPVLEVLEDLTAIDSASWIREPGNIDAFVQVMLTECPEEVEKLMGEGGQ